MAKSVESKNSASKLKSSDYDIEIIETHHKHKVDAPSGTALSLGKFASKGRGVDFSNKKILNRTGKPNKRNIAELKTRKLYKKFYK